MCTKKYKIGYTDGVYDLFHVGHLNMINTARNYCEYLIVGVHGDEVVREYKENSDHSGRRSEENYCVYKRS